MTILTISTRGHNHSYTSDYAVDSWRLEQGWLIMALHGGHEVFFSPSYVQSFSVREEVA